MTPEQLLAKLLAQREVWVEVDDGAEPGKGPAFKIRRPPEADWPKFRQVVEGKVQLVCNLPEAVEYTVDWRNITEADLIGSAGSSDPAPFSAALWRELAPDRLAWARKIEEAILDSIIAHHRKVAAIEGNSAPSST